MTSSLALGVAAACLASALYNTAVYLQASEARSTPFGLGFRARLIYELIQRRRWIGGLLLGLLAAPLQVVALMLAPLTVVQPTLAVGLLLLLAFGRRQLGEPVGKRELACVAAIIAGVLGLAWAGPQHSSEHARFGHLVLAMGLLAGVASVPVALSFSRYRGRAFGYFAAVGAGLWYACGSLSAKFIADDLSAGAVLFVCGWVTATALAAIVGLLSENTALQRRPASRVSPVVFVVEMLVPVLFAPVITSEHWATQPLRLGVLLASLIAVVAATAVLASSDRLGALARA